MAGFSARVFRPAVRLGVFGALLLLVLGELGNGTQMDSSIPVVVSGLTGVTAIAAGEYHACAITTDGGLWCWGSNDRGELGNGTLVSSSLPVPVCGLSNTIEATAGWEYTCAITASGRVVCWGANAEGQLGDGTNVDSEYPTPVTW
jgi:alpha-tubulin suppressor-like RCC1 family protein